MSRDSYRGIDPRGLTGLADVAEQYAARVRAAGHESGGLLDRRRSPWAAAVVAGLSALGRQLVEESGELRWRAGAIAAEPDTNLGAGRLADSARSARAEFAALAVFDMSGWQEAYQAWREPPEMAALAAMSPGEVSAAFDRMAPSVAMDFARSHSVPMGRLDGAPPELRYLANRLLLEERIARLQRQIAELRSSQDSVRFKWLDPFRRIGWFPLAHLADTAIQQLQQQITRYRRWLVEKRQILLFDAGGDGRVIEVFGDLAAADRVAVVVPGIANDLSNFSDESGGFRSDAGALFAAVGDAGSDDVATVAWLGYDTPDGADAVLRDAAVAAAPALARFLEGIDPDHEKHITVVAHSYGSVVAGITATAGMEADDLVFVGSPGTTLSSADEAGLRPAGRVWAGLAGNDPIGVGVSPRELPPVWVPPPLAPAWFMFDMADGGAEELWHGPNPAADAFGALRISTEGSSGHSGYFTAGSLDNLARIVQGRYSEVEMAP